jgi:hypothetical protein
LGQRRPAPSSREPNAALAPRVSRGGGRSAARDEVMAARSNLPRSPSARSAGGDHRLLDGRTTAYTPHPGPAGAWGVIFISPGRRRVSSDPGAFRGSVMIRPRGRRRLSPGERCPYSGPSRGLRRPRYRESCRCDHVQPCHRLRLHRNAGPARSPRGAPSRASLLFDQSPVRSNLCEKRQRPAVGHGIVRWHHA